MGGLRRSICSTCTSLSSSSSASRLSITRFSTAYGLRKRRATRTHSTRATGITEAPETREGGDQHTLFRDAGAHSLGYAGFQEGAPLWATPLSVVLSLSSLWVASERA